MLDVCDCPVQVNLVEHYLSFAVVFLLPFLLGHLALLRSHCFLHIKLVLALLFVHDDGIRVVLDGLVVSAQLELGIGFAEIVLYHVVVTIL